MQGPTKSMTLDEIKTFVIEKKCLLDAEWLKHGFEDPDQPCAGKSFWDIVDRVAETADAGFLRWFYDHAVPASYDDLTSHEPEVHQMRSFWKRADANQNDLKGKEIEKKILDRLKKQVDTATFACLKRFSCDMLAFREDGKSEDQQFVYDLAVPIDPLFWRLQGKLQRRRDTKSINFLMQKNQELLYKEVLADLISFSASRIEHQIQHGASDDELDASLLALTSSAVLLAKADRSHPILQTNLKVIGGSCPFLVLDGKCEVNDGYEAPGNADLLRYSIENEHGCACNAFGLATRMGQLSVLQWLAKKFSDRWTDAQIIQMIHLAVYCEKRDVVNWLLQEDSGGSQIPRAGRFCAAVYGAAGSGQLALIKRYFPEARDFLRHLQEESSPITAAVSGWYFHLKHYENEEGAFTRFLECINWMGSQPECRRLDGAVAATTNATDLTYFFEIFKSLTPTDIWEYRHPLPLMCRDLLYRRLEQNDLTRLMNLIRVLAVDHGVDIQSIVHRPSFRGEVDIRTLKFIEKCQEDQLRRWAPFHSLACGLDASDIQLVDCYNAEGLKMAHCAAACGRVDVLDLIGRKFPDQMDQLDKSGRSVEEIAKLNGSPDLICWVEQRAAGARLGTLLSAQYRKIHAVRDKNMKLKRLTRVQGVWRGLVIRKVYRSRIEARLRERMRYNLFWSRLVSKLDSELKGANSWDLLKQDRYNLARNIENLMENMEEYGDTFKLLDEAGEEAFYESDDEDQGANTAALDGDTIATKDTTAEEKKEEEGVSGESESEAEDLTPLPGELQDSDFDRPLPPMDNIKLTKEVLKWIRTTESKYVKLFLRRIEQLAAGQRSRILQKNLVGSATTIYETYLEQKKAQRIMWTPCIEDGKHSILVWYVAKHKEVSHLMELIDQAQKRSSTIFVSAKTLYADLSEDTLMIDSSEIFLDPIRDVPLKLHQVPRSDIRKLQSASWVPALRLTPEERVCVEKDGTVLLLGRSGTG